jgi:hypothetical protein
MDHESKAAPSLLSEQMDRWSRNERLYETLKGMGLFVSPIPEPDDPTKIRYMIVSADLPPVAGAAEADRSGGERPRAARPAHGDADNVVDFPTVA